MGFSIKKEKPCLCIEVKDFKVISVDKPISILLEKNNCWSIEMKLIKKSDLDDKVIPYQIDVHQENKIWFNHNSDGRIKTIYCFVRRKNPINFQTFNFKRERGDLKLAFGERSLIHYRYEMKTPPEGVNKLFQKSGYIHPVITLNGDTLSRIQPPDHYHHYGIWGPWTRTKIENISVDFWNLGHGQGTVLFKKFNSIDSGPVYASFSAHQEHFNLTKKNLRQLAIDENLSVKVWKNNNPNQYFIDYRTNFSSPLENGILFEAYRYGGGLGFRFKEYWNKDNCEVITSERKNRVAADGTSARWCLVYGEANNGKDTSGVMFMSHPNNQSHPEPMRVWPLDANNGRGDVFFEFCPIRDEEWKIEPIQSYELNYRMLVFDGKITLEDAEQHWKAFAFRPLIKILKN